MPSLKKTNSQQKMLRQSLLFITTPHLPSKKLSMLFKQHSMLDLKLNTLQSQSQLLLMKTTTSLLTTLKTSSLLLKMPTLTLKNQMDTPKLLPNSQNQLHQLNQIPNPNLTQTPMLNLTQTQRVNPKPIQTVNQTLTVNQTQTVNQTVHLTLNLKPRKLKNVTQRTYSDHKYHKNLSDQYDLIVMTIFKFIHLRIYSYPLFNY